MRLVGLALLAAWLGATGCIVGGTGGITTTPTRASNEGPIPDPLSGDGPPALEETDEPGLLAAPSLDANLYYHQPSELWYRHTFRRWYQAFRWNGNWFLVDEVPEFLADRSIAPEELPTLPEYERGELPTLPEYEPRDLPTLPEYEDEPLEYEDDPEP